MRLVFTMTAGRTGSAFLAELLRRHLPGALVYHEHLYWRAFGRRTPDVSHLVRFNNEGFTEYVRDFWRGKLDEILASRADTYVETSHVLMKAGLVEALQELPQEHDIHLVSQHRDLAPTIVSYGQRFDFINLGNRYLWYLDPSYRCNLVNPSPLVEHGVAGIRLWYLLEMEARSAWYRARVADRPNFTVHRTRLETVTTPEGATALVRAITGDERPVTVPPKVNASPAGVSTPMGVRQRIEQLVERVSGFDPEALVRPLVAAGSDPFSARVGLPALQTLEGDPVGAA